MTTRKTRRITTAGMKPFISRTLAFEDGIEAFEEAAAGRATDVKIQIEFPEASSIG